MHKTHLHLNRILAIWGTTEFEPADQAQRPQPGLLGLLEYCFICVLSAGKGGPVIGPWSGMGVLHWSKHKCWCNTRGLQYTIQYSLLEHRRAWQSPPGVSEVGGACAGGRCKGQKVSLAMTDLGNSSSCHSSLSSMSWMEDAPAGSPGVLQDHAAKKHSV